MKKIFILAAALVLALCVLAGCGCRRNPGTIPTETTPMTTTAPTDAPATVPVTEEATTAATDSTIVPTETTDMNPGGMDSDGMPGADATVEGNARNRSMNRK